MKKLFVLALAATTLLVGCKSKDSKNEPTPPPSGDVTITGVPETLELTAGDQKTFTVTVDPAGTAITATSNDAAVVKASASGTTVMLLAFKEGTATITVSAGSTSKTCVVTVKPGQGGGGAGELVDCVKIWPVVMDETSAAKYAGKIVESFGPDDVDNFLYIWATGETYAANPSPTGSNFFGTQSNGGYLAMTVTDKGWAGMGYFVGVNKIGGVNALIDKIKANPSNYGFHMAIKSTDQASHYFAVFGGMGDAGLKWGVGTTSVGEATDLRQITRNGAWNSININFGAYAAIFAAATTSTTDGMNIFYMGSEGIMGAQMNLDACYFYQIAEE